MTPNHTIQRIGASRSALLQIGSGWGWFPPRMVDVRRDEAGQHL